MVLDQAHVSITGGMGGTKTYEVRQPQGRPLRCSSTGREIKRMGIYITSIHRCANVLNDAIV